LASLCPTHWGSSQHSQLDLGKGPQVGDRDNKGREKRMKKEREEGGRRKKGKEKRFHTGTYFAHF